MHLVTMLLLLGFKEPPVTELPLYEMPQAVCPGNMDEYMGRFRWWAKDEVRARQLERAQPLYPI